jgi:hypothetical protein
MRTVIAGLIVVALLALAVPAGAMPIDNYGPIPSGSPVSPSPAPSAGAETWVVVASAALAFALGAVTARLAPALRPRIRPS